MPTSKIMNQRIDRLLVGANLAIHNVLRAISQDGKHRAFEPEVYYLAIPCKMERSTASPVLEVHRQFGPNDYPKDTILEKLNGLALRLDSSRPQALSAEDIRAAISACFGTSKVAFCSGTVPIGNHVACVALAIHKHAYDEVPRVTEIPHPFEEEVQFSLLDNAIDLYLKDCFIQLRNPQVDPTHGWNPATEILHVSGFWMAVRATFGVAGNFSPNFFESCVALASAQYEKQQACGTILICGKQDNEIGLTMSLKRGVALEDIRTSRKLLQLCAAGHFLLCDGDEVFGLGTVDQCNGSKRFTIAFTRPGIWEMQYGGAPLMVVQNGIARLPSREFPDFELRSHLAQVFGNLERDQQSRLCALAQTAVSQGHGVTLVVSADAAKEAERLQEQSFRIEPIALNEELMPAIANIDGAILLDIHGSCHAIGVILDGRVRTDNVALANRGRGARYNSAVRYTNDEHTPPCIVIVKSEDGMLDFFVSLSR